ncbi:hypothetical protein ACFZBZ_14365 [Streptomyces sp. NPDC008196]
MSVQDVGLRTDRVYRSAGGRLVEPAVGDLLPEHCSYRVRLRRGGH